LLFSSPPWESAVYWALDLETGGLDSKKDPILAVGMVPVRGGTIRLGESYRSLVRPESGKALDPESVRYHQLVWGEVRDAPSLAEVMPEVERRLEGAVLLVHHASVDVRFLKRAFRGLALRWPAPPVVDTVDLLIRAASRSRLRNPDAPDNLPNLNLSKARRAYQLPEYQAHDALTDAIATAELFLVLRKVIGARTLRQLR
jgi:DNA polymerase-3 subunit epsilon